MRHRVKGRKLGRTASHRRATLKALSTALILEHRIETTLAKAKELRTYVEPIITRAKVDTTHNRRTAFSYLQNKYAVTELFDVVAPVAADRPGGYTRVLKTGFRAGDSAEMAVIELVDFNDVKPEGKSDKKKRTRRAGRSAGTQKAVASAPAEEKEVADTAEAVEEKEVLAEEVTADLSDEKETATEAAVEAEEVNATEEVAEKKATDEEEVADKKEEEKKAATDPDQDEAAEDTSEKKEEK